MLYLDHMQRKWQYSKVGDTLLITDDVYEKDSISTAKFTFLDYYGSYFLELKYKGSETIHKICYKGSKRDFFISKIAIFDSIGRHIGDRQEKLFSPVRIKICNADKSQVINERTTKVLKQLGLDGSSIGGFAKPNFSPGRTNNFDLQFLTSTKQF